jgi:hypothetical protein
MPAAMGITLVNDPRRIYLECRYTLTTGGESLPSNAEMVVLSRGLRTLYNPGSAMGGQEGVICRNTRDWIRIEQRSRTCYTHRDRLCLAFYTDYTNIVGGYIPLIVVI